MRAEMTTLSFITPAVLLWTALAACTDATRVTKPGPPRDRAGADIRMPTMSAVAASATVTALGALPGYTGAVPIAINGSGTTVGFAGNQEVAVSFDPPTLLYRDENYPFDRAGAAYGINDAGVISGQGLHNFGTAIFAGPGPDGWVPQLPGGISQFGGYVNNAGEVVGSTSFDPLNRLPLHGTVWVPGASGYSAIDLGTFNDYSTEVLGLAPNLSGSGRIVVGRYAATTFNGYTPLVWQNGAWSELPAPPGCFADRNSGQAKDVSDGGIIVGSTCLGAGLWENGTVRVLHAECEALLPPGVGGASDAHAIAVTSSTPSRILIVGSCVEMPIVWYDDGQGGYAAELLPLLEGDTEGVAHDVNAAGQIVGYTRKSPFSSDPTAHAVRWTFTPPPLGPGNQQPTASPGGPYGEDEGASITFDGTASADPDGQALTFEWDFGDGSEHSSGVTPSHVYADNGTYVVTLTVDDGNGGVDVASTTAVIENTAPQVNAGAASSIESGQTLNFSGTVTDAGTADTPSSWTLDWGDGSAPLTGSAAVPGAVLADHQYYATGTFTVLLTVTDKDGGVGAGSRTVTVDPRSVTVAVSPDPVSLSEKRSKDIDVVILSTSALDATQIDPATLRAGDGNDPDALPLRRKNGTYVLSVRDVNRDGLPDLGFSVAKLDPNLGLAAPGTTVVVRGAVPTIAGAIVVRGSATIVVSP